MKHQEPNPPLPPDPPGREDIMSPEEGADPDRHEGSPLPRDPAAGEDVISDGRQDGTTAGS